MRPLALLLAAGLAVLTVTVYFPVVRFQFVNYDDPSYVTDEPHVNTGITAGNLRWSLTTFANANWHPLTNVSHMLDVQLFGMNAGAHHGVNLGFHVVNVLLLFWLLVAARSQPWPAAFVAALFAVHPLNVQSVAWIAERKNLLSTTFWLLALMAHVRFRRTRRVASYLLVIACAALALASKPMAVTLPLTLVLFDIWPLAAQPDGQGSVIARYARELAPSLALAATCGVLTIVAQREAHAIQTLVAIPLLARLANGLMAYTWYLKELVWPTHLAVFYPLPESTISLLHLLPAALALGAISAFAIVKRNALPFVAVGWCWYVGTLIPVAGLIQVGGQAYADRYAYVPLIGIFIALAWSLERLTAPLPMGFRRATGVGGAATIVALAFVTRSQLPYWHDTIALFQHAIDVVPQNALAENNLGMALVAEDRMTEALGHFQNASTFAPWDSDAHANLGNALRALGRPGEAVEAYQKALEAKPEDATTYFNLATALADLGRQDDAVVQLERAIRLDPGYVKPRLMMATILYSRGHVDEALSQLRDVARIDPANTKVAEWIRKLESRLNH